MKDDRFTNKKTTTKNHECSSECPDNFSSSKKVKKIKLMFGNEKLMCLLLESSFMGLCVYSSSRNILINYIVKKLNLPVPICCCLFQSPTKSFILYL